MRRNGGGGQVGAQLLQALVEGGGGRGQAGPHAMRSCPGKEGLLLSGYALDTFSNAKGQSNHVMKLVEMFDLDLVVTAPAFVFAE